MSVEFGRLPRLFVSVAPERHDRDLLTIDRCKDVVTTSQVRARGWYFPHIARDRLAAGPDGNYLMNSTVPQGYIDNREDWRMHRNGHFLFRMMLWEAPDLEAQRRMRDQAARNLAGRSDAGIDGFVEFVMLIYSISEAFVFASRLAQAIPYESAVQMVIGLRGVRNWALGSNNPAVALDEIHMCLTDNLETRTTIPLQELIADPLATAIPSIVAIFQQFGWLDPSPAMIANWQRSRFR